jgi:hypothetical protein
MILMLVLEQDKDMVADSVSDVRTNTISRFRHEAEGERASFQEASTSELYI